MTTQAFADALAKYKQEIHGEDITSLAKLKELYDAYNNAIKQKQPFQELFDKYSDAKRTLIYPDFELVNTKSCSTWELHLKSWGTDPQMLEPCLAAQLARNSGSGPFYSSSAGLILYHAPYEGLWRKMVDILIKFGAKIITQIPNPNHSGRVCYLLGFPTEWVTKHYKEKTIDKMFDFDIPTTNLPTSEVWKTDIND